MSMGDWRVPPHCGYVSAQLAGPTQCHVSWMIHNCFKTEAWPTSRAQIG
jgi:hypothetical protein